MASRREKVILDTGGLDGFAAQLQRMRHVAASWARNDRAGRENPLYAADPKLAGPQRWPGDDN